MNKEEFLSDLADALEVEADELDEKYELDESNWTSLVIVSAISIIDEHYDITVDGQALKNCKTVGELVGLIEDKMGA